MEEFALETLKMTTSEDLKGSEAPRIYAEAFKISIRPFPTLSQFS